MKAVSPGAQVSDLPMHQEVLSEERRLQAALERVRLEDAAKRPAISKRGWLVKTLLLVALCMANADSHYQYLINIIVIAFLIYGGDSRVHSRIDAIMELERLEKMKQR